MACCLPPPLRLLPHSSHSVDLLRFSGPPALNLLSSCSCALQLYEEVYAECDKYADVEAVIVPPPPDHLPTHEPGRVFIKVANTEQAMKCKKVFDGRLFDNKKVQVGAPASQTCSQTWGGCCTFSHKSYQSSQVSANPEIIFQGCAANSQKEVLALALHKDPWLLLLAFAAFLHGAVSIVQSCIAHRHR